MSFNAQVFGKYFLVDRIATGGMAEIFKAKTYGEGGFENLVVIKRILSHLSANQDFVDMFIDEAKVSVALQAANIVRVYDFGKIGDNYFMAMELVHGKDLRHILRKLAKKRRYLPIELVVFIALEAAKGLHYAHEKRDLRGRPYGIVHRDVSPSNVLVSYEGDVKVADFGIAKAASNTYDTNSGILKGKFEYMSPEQARGVDVDHRSDLFSLGILMHEMLTARRLFKSETDLQTVERIKNASAPPPSEVVPRVPEALDRIVLKALAAEREDRYQTARELADDLQEYLFPANHDQLRAELARFMEELFAEDIAEENQRLDQGSAEAVALRERLPGGTEGWDGATQSTLDQSIYARPWTLWALMATMLLATVVLVGVGAVVIVVGATRDQAPPAPTAPATGSIDIAVLPSASIWVDGSFVADSETATLLDVAPGTHAVRLERSGYVPVDVTIRVDAGQAAKVVRTLSPEPLPEPAPVAAPSPSPDPAPTRLSPSPSPSPAPAPAPSGDPGQLTVALTGGGWAYVFIDDVKLDKTAPSSFSLPPGTHTIRVENPDLGIGHTEKVTITGGETTTVRVRPL